jgi:hypothetical protein
LWLLAAVAFVTGCVDAFYRPAAASLQRELVPVAALGRGVPAGQVGIQLANAVGPPLGGVVVAVGGLGAAAALDAVSFLVVLVVLFLVRGAVTVRPEPATAAAGGTAWWRPEGLRVVAGHPLLRVGVGLLCVVAGMLLPVFGVLVPLLGRQRGWEPGLTGGLAGAITAGMAAAALVVVVRGMGRRPGLVVAGGLAVAGCGLVGMALAAGPWQAMACGLVAGAGMGLFTAHLAPLLIGHTPAGRVARVQSVVMLANAAPLLVTNLALGTLSETAGAAPVIAGIGFATLGCAVLALVSPTLRNARAAT